VKVRGRLKWPPLWEKANKYVSYLPFPGSWLENSNLHCNLAAGESPLGANPEPPIGALVFALCHLLGFRFAPRILDRYSQALLRTKISFRRLNRAVSKQT
jgi:hypothetical protein